MVLEMGCSRVKKMQGIDRRSVRCFHLQMFVRVGRRGTPFGKVRSTVPGVLHTSSILSHLYALDSKCIYPVMTHWMKLVDCLVLYYKSGE